ncbi:hypothetical protein CPB84DRAFT_1744384 [Gymnopilus junonius]|uniref:Uncharacterized protein n=1 Tax=Gymnopilus junonius TaxID=109634 RepID=A0A9P5NYN6_GYMJU|nr:hypothetical protein CPB84DRAFT_1744384 [Gymnopilus junonius]
MKVVKGKSNHKSSQGIQSHPPLEDGPRGMQWQLPRHSDHREGGMLRRKKAAPESDKTSTHFCNICKINVKLGFGGEKNWQQHIQSNAHRKGEAGTSQTKPITAFFATKASDLPRASSYTCQNVLSPPRLFNKLSATPTDIPSPSISTLSSILFMRLRNSIDSLPEAIPIGTATNILAGFSGNPAAGIEDGDEVWEKIDTALNRVIGFGVTGDETTALIQRGEFGMDGLYHWLEGCVSELRVDKVLLEGKINCLVDAMVKLGADPDVRQDFTPKHLSVMLILAANREIAIGTENIPRIKTLIHTAQHASASIFTILDCVKKAAACAYSPKGYEYLDYQLGYLIYKIGGWMKSRFRKDYVGTTLPTKSLGLKEKKVHLATEATVIGVSILSENLNDYTTKAFAISGSCKMETFHEQEKLLRLAADSVQTPDFDGFEIDEETCTTSMTKSQLIKDGMDLFTSDILLAPNDRQDVVLMVKLLLAYCTKTFNLTPPPTCDRPNHFFISSDYQIWTFLMDFILIILGHIYGNLLRAYLDVTLTLHEQLVALSTAAHLILAIYHINKGGFIPVQTYFDVMSMIKTMYFSVAKMQIDDLMGLFHVILLGTDGLEKVFVQCVKILEEHPKWGGQSRCLKLKPLPSKSGDVLSKYDHINPKSWTGAWISGRRAAEKHLQDASMSAPFSSMELVGGYDILCPFGKSKVVLLDGTLAEGEHQETEEEMDHYILLSAESSTSEALPVASAAAITSNSNSLPCVVTGVNLGLESNNEEVEDLEPNLDNTAGLTESNSGLLDHGETQNLRPQYDPWILIDGKKVQKATILRYYSNPFAVTDSKDRLKRVCGFSQYDESAREVSFNDVVFSPEEFESDVHVLIQDPALILPDEDNWEWSSAFEAGTVFLNAEGRWIDLVNPSVKRASRGCNSGKDTYTFWSSELHALAASLQNCLGNDIHHLPQVRQTALFPYRSLEAAKTTLFSKVMHAFYVTKILEWGLVTSLTLIAVEHVIKQKSFSQSFPALHSLLT